MKLLRFLIVILVGGFLFSSCQKEYSSESGNAHGSLKADAAGDCLPITIVGNFKKDSIIKDSNYADIQVNITQTGTYFIKTDTVNGYSFSAAGVVAATGTNTIRLKASGKPIAAGVDLFAVKFETSQCEFNVTATGTGGGGGGGVTAIYTLGGSPGTCTGATLSGTYTQGVPTTGSNTALVNVNVTQAGNYTLSSTTVNGVTFSGTGSFSGTGANTILLTASGTPAAAGPFTYPISSGTSNCDFSVTYASGTPPTNFITADVDGVSKTFNTAITGTYDNTSLPGSIILNISGKTSSTGNESINLAVTKMGTSIGTGTYTVNQAPGTIVIGNYTDAANIKYFGQPDGTMQPQPFTITISSIISTTPGRVTGTFSGPVKDNNGMGPGVKVITNGQFSVPL